MRKQVRKRKSVIRSSGNANTDAMGKSVAKYLSANGWDAFVVGPCEVRVQRGYVVTSEGDRQTGDLSGKTLGQYEFIARFYGKRQEIDPCAQKEKK